MIAKKCDRCGAYYDLPTPETQDGFKFNGIDLTRTYENDLSMADVVQTYDLCPTCCSKIVDWLKKHQE